MNIEEEKKELKAGGISVPAMKMCQDLIEYGLCVAQKERGFEVLLHARDISPEELVEKELGFQESFRADNKRALRSEDHHDGASASGCHKRQRAEEERDELESDSSGSSSSDEDSKPKPTLVRII